MFLMPSRTWTLALAPLAGSLLCVSPVCAQQAPEAAPAQAADIPAQSAQPAQAPPGPVGGVEQYRLEGGGLGRSYYTPRLTVQELYSTNPSYAPTAASSQSDTITTITGGLTLQLLQRNSTFSLDYSSEGIIYNTQTQSNSVIQQLGVTEKLTLRRWNLLFGENLSYLPSSAFQLNGLGYTPGISAGLPGVGGTTNFNQYLQPTQTIGSPSVSQLSSSSAFQAQYDLGAGSSLNGSFVAGILHYFGSSLFNSRNFYGRFGYDKALTRRDTLSFNFMVSRFDFSAGAPGFTSYAFQIGYRRLLTGRLHLSVLGGPMVTHFSAMTGQPTVPGGSNLVNWSFNTTLDYVSKRWSVSTQYSHGVAGGSGFFVGTLTDQVSASFTRQFSRTWTGAITGGFARNSSLQQTTPGTTSTGALSFNNWFTGLSFSRTLGRYSKLSFIYNASEQTGNTTTCAMGLGCAPIALIQTVGVTLNWSTRPLKIE
jgi:hypothetical protein